MHARVLFPHLEAEVDGFSRDGQGDGVAHAHHVRRAQERDPACEWGRVLGCACVWWWWWLTGYVADETDGCVPD
jgi:hypothetical protein